MVLFGSGSELESKRLCKAGKAFVADIQVDLFGPFGPVFQEVGGVVEAFFLEPAHGRRMKMLFKLAFEGGDAHMGKKGEFFQAEFVEGIAFHDLDKMAQVPILIGEEGLQKSCPSTMKQIKHDLFEFGLQNFGPGRVREPGNADQRSNKGFKEVIVGAGQDGAKIFSCTEIVGMALHKLLQDFVRKEKEDAAVGVSRGRKFLRHQAVPGFHDQKMTLVYGHRTLGGLDFFEAGLQKAKYVVAKVDLGPHGMRWIVVINQGQPLLGIYLQILRECIDLEILLVHRPKLTKKDARLRTSFFQYKRIA